MKLKITKPTQILPFLISQLKLSSATKARELLKKGRVEVDGKPVVRANHVLEPGQEVCVSHQKSDKKQKAPFEILFEDDDILVAVKPAGILSVHREGGTSKTFHQMVNEYTRVFLVHRLDREVSGILMFAKSLNVQRQLEASWKENDKLYYAVVEGALSPKEGRIESWLTETKALKVYSTAPGDDAKQAITHYRVVRETPRYSLVEVRLETGRKNQIRVHMADQKCPIIGDEKYGSKTYFGGRIALHAFHLAFDHPVSRERISLNSPLPKEFEKVI